MFVSSVIGVCCMLILLNGANAIHSDVLAHGRNSFKSDNLKAMRSTSTFVHRVGAPYTGVHVTCKDRLDDETAKYCCTLLTECNDIILPGETKYGIYNTKMENLNSCQCDGEFQNCLLRASENSKSNLYEKLGFSYFDLKTRDCFLQLYNASCDGPFFDKSGKEYEENLSERYFCVALHTMKYRDIMRVP